jgi:hypothetical protein
MISERGIRVCGIRPSPKCGDEFCQVFKIHSFRRETWYSLDANIANTFLRFSWHMTAPTNLESRATSTARSKVIDFSNRCSFKLEVL